MFLDQVQTSGWVGIRQDKTQVWQLVPCQFLAFLRNRTVLWPSDYELVALVKTTRLENAFRWTNDEGWRRPEVQRVTPVHPRSTSVGDVLITPQGVLYIVCDRGFGLMGAI